MALNDILQKITSDAKEEVENISITADKDVQALKKEASEKNKDLESVSTVTRNRRASKASERIISKARHEAKMGEDQNLRSLVDEVFEIVANKLVEIPEKSYTQLVEKNLKFLPHSKGSFLIAPEREEETKAIIEKHHQGSIIKVAHNGTLLGGFVFETTDKEFDYSFRSLLEELRKQNEITVSQEIISSIHG